MFVVGEAVVPKDFVNETTDYFEDWRDCCFVNFASAVGGLYFAVNYLDGLDFVVMFVTKDQCVGLNFVKSYVILLWADERRRFQMTFWLT